MYSLCSAEKQIYYEELTYVIMEARKYGSWRPKTAGGVVPLEVQSLRTKSTNGLVPVPGQGNANVPALRYRKRALPIFPFLFYLGPKQMGWCPPPLGRAICCTQFTKSNGNFFQKHPHTHSEVMFS